MGNGLPLRMFRQGQQVRVRECNSVARDLGGRTGTVHRLRFADDGAWVRMHEDLPDRHRSFMRGDDRERDILLFPDDCVAADGADA